MKTPGLDELRTQARRTYRFWPIYLMLRLRQAEQHLTPTQRAELGPGLGLATAVVAELPAPHPDWAVELLVEYGLLTGTESLPATPPPAFLRWLEGECLGFVVKADGLEFSLQTAEQCWSVKLLRTTAVHQDNLIAVATIFNQMALELSPQVAFEAAQLWAALQGARQLDWYIDLAVNPVAVIPALPPHRRAKGRGKGKFLLGPGY